MVQRFPRQRVPHRATIAPGRRRLVAAAAATLALVASSTVAGTARAQSGLQVTPDSRRVLISKDLAGQRWAITRNPDRSVTGNVFFPGGGAPQFVWCSEVGASNGELRFSCSGADACPLAPCTSSEWVFIAEVPLAESFFGGALPTGGSASASSDASDSRPASPAIPLGRPASTAGATENRPSGIQITPDSLVSLVSKDVGDQRWAIGRNQDGTVTGNVFFPGGGEPQFVWCEPTAPAGETLVFRCFGSPPCAAGTTAACGSGWTLISDNVPLAASFFSARATVDMGAFIVAVTAQLGEDGAFDGIVLALDRGYSLRQVVRAGLTRRLLATGEIKERSGATEAPAGPPLGLIETSSSTDAASVSGALVVNLSLLRAALKEKAATLGRLLLSIFVGLVSQGYSMDQIVEHVLTDGAILIVGSHVALTDRSGVIRPDHPTSELFDDLQDPVCGNGKLEGSERCDGPQIAGSCLDRGEVGTVKCTATCQIDYSGCVDTCGDGVRQPEEICDGVDLGGVTCQTLGRGFTGGTLVCAESCAFDASGCTNCAASAGDPSLAGALGGCTPCGNGVRNAGEACDGGDLGGASCQSLGFQSGPLSCTASCTFDTGACTNSACGTGTVACEGGCIPTGGDCCTGEGVFCNPGTVCAGSRTCCPAAFPQLCNGVCLAAGATCCPAGSKLCGEECIPSSAPCCRNGTRESGEACDGADLGGATCQSQGLPPGTLRCNLACELDTSGCACGAGTTTCGNVCAPAGATCCAGGGYCDPGEFCVGDGNCCPTTHATFCSGQCLPSGSVCCGDQYACPPGYACVGGINGAGPTACCPAGSPVPCAGGCYSAGSVCCGDYACFPGDQCSEHGGCE